MQAILRNILSAFRLGIIDWYIIKKYLSTFFFTALLFTLIAVTIDFSDKVEDFIEEPVTKWQIIKEYYGGFIPHINGLLWPLYALIAVIFFTSRLAFNSEIIAIFGAGVSFRRLMRPYIVSASVLMLIHLFSSHILIPYGNKSRLNFEYKYVYKHSDKGKKNDMHMFISPDTKVYVKYYSKTDSIARDFRLETIKNNRLVYYLKAEEAKWVDSTQKWRLKDYEIHTFDGVKESLQVVHDVPKDTAIALRPDDFVRYNNQKEMLTTPELLRNIAIEQQRGLANSKVYSIEIHRRTADVFTILILTLIGMAVAARKVRGGMGLHLAIGISLGALFIFMSKVSITFAISNSIPPLLGVWIPNIVFAIIAYWLASRAQQ
ncbi:MAG: LptF/LptG family permease [Saprospiraceae bacterium]|nr:LptF/LptG family permease [Saprospiraceae bacterium]MBP7679540.1 LptF/LptG family permease [Saprospiraceae bacterium]